MATKNKRKGYDTALNSKIRKIEDISNKEPLDIRNLHLAKERLKSAWESLIASHQVFLALLTRSSLRMKTRSSRRQRYITRPHWMLPRKS